MRAVLPRKQFISTYTGMLCMQGLAKSGALSSSSAWGLFQGILLVAHLLSKMHPRRKPAASPVGVATKRVAQPSQSDSSYRLVLFPKGSSASAAAGAHGFKQPASKHLQSKHAARQAPMAAVTRRECTFTVDKCLSLLTPCPPTA